MKRMWWTSICFFSASLCFFLTTLARSGDHELAYAAGVLNWIAGMVALVRLRAGVAAQPAPPTTARG